MTHKPERIRQLNAILHQIIDDWYQGAKENYVTEEESRELGVEPEVKLFHGSSHHRIKFQRKKELEVTYGLGVHLGKAALIVESSVNNKSAGFDYDFFVSRLKSHYWSSRNEKPWTDPDFDHYSYGDLMPFEPVMGGSVALDIRKDKADIIRLSFEINPDHEDKLLAREDVLRDLIENYCLAPLRRAYAESYREV